MKKLVSEPKRCLITLISLVLFIELLLTINNKLIQIIGIVFTPITVFLGFMLLKNDYKRVK